MTMTKILSVLVSVLFLAAWGIKDINKQINETNVIVGNWCSGTIIDKDKKLIVTANHCLENLVVQTLGQKEMFDGKFVRVISKKYKPVLITINKYTLEGDLFSTTEFYAEVVGTDFNKDLGILRIFNEDIIFADSAKINIKPVRRGDRVYTVGNPFMFDGTYTEGIVSRPKLHLILRDRELDVIVFTAPIAPGSSGGALYNDKGEYIGTTNWGMPGGPYMASPSSNLYNLLKKLRLWKD